MTRLILLTAAMLTLVAGAIAWSWPSAWAQTGSASSALETRRALAAAQNEARRARERAALLDRQASSARRAGDQATLAAAALAARVQQAEAALAASQADLALVAEARRSLDTRLTRESAPVSRLLAALQLQVRRPPLLQLLQPGSITDAVHLRAVLASVEPQIRNRTASLRTELGRARALEREGARLTARRQAQQSDLVAQREKLATLSAVERIKARRAASAADREAELAFTSGIAARDLSALLRRVEAAPEQRNPGAARPAPVPANGTTAPYLRPVSGRLATDRPGARKGLTLEPRPRAVVVAPGAGRVAFVGPYRGFGIIAIVEHADGWTSLVTGLANAQVAAGQTVVAGSPLGQAAERDPRITIELRKDGVPVDPGTRLR